MKMHIKRLVRCLALKCSLHFLGGGDDDLFVFEGLPHQVLNQLRPKSLSSGTEEPSIED